jgi:hypothetical protein
VSALDKHGQTPLHLAGKVELEVADRAWRECVSLEQGTAGPHYMWCLLGIRDSFFARSRSHAG